MICENCKAIFVPKSKTQKYCNLTCANQNLMRLLSIKKQKEYEANPKFCANCSIPLPWSKRFRNNYCGHTCAATDSNKGYLRRKYSERPCENCMTVFQPDTSSKGKYCSFKCSKEGRKIKMNQKMVDGEIKSRSALRFILIRERGNFCTECSQGPVWNEKPLTLQVDHIDGDPDNNKGENLRLLCPNCHTQTETFTSRKRTGTQFCSRSIYRRNYYQKNKDRHRA